MAINQIFTHFIKLFRNLNPNNTRFNVISSKYLIYIVFIIVFFSVFILVSNSINKKKEQEAKNFYSVIDSKQFIGLSDYFIKKINSPYKEIDYLIENNDSIEKILRKFKVNRFKLFHKN